MAHPRNPKNDWPIMQRCDRDGYRLVMQGLRTVVRIAQQEEDNKHALAAGQWLVQYGESVIARKQIDKPQPVRRLVSERDAIIHELRGLYAKALGEAPLIVEAQSVPVTETEPETEPSK